MADIGPHEKGSHAEACFRESPLRGAMSLQTHPRSLTPPQGSSRMASPLVAPHQRASFLPMKSRTRG